MQELDVARRARVESFDELDRVGRLRLDDGQQVRFGATACQGFVPVVGSYVFVTALGPHPLGGLKAGTIRAAPTTEAQVRAEAEARAARDASELERARAARREVVGPMTTYDAIVARIKASVMPEEDHDADEQLLYALVDDLDLVGPSVEHAKAIVQAISESDPMAHFGSPGPLVHYAERFVRNGYVTALFEVAKHTPTAHFLWMLGRVVNGNDEWSPPALSIIEGYATSKAAPPALRDQAAEFVASTRV